MEVEIVLFHVQALWLVWRKFGSHVAYDEQILYNSSIEDVDAEALELFKKFLTFPAKEDILTFVLEHFSLNEHANEEIEIMLKDFNKKLEKRRI